MEDVDASKGLLSKGHHTLQVVSLGDVDVDERRFATGVFDEAYCLPAPLLVQIGDGKRGALAGQCEGSSAADAGAGAGDNGHSAFGVHR